MTHQNVIAIVQARLGSTRLPDKVLAPIVGRPMLWHLINRLQHAKSIDIAVVALPNTARDHRIAAFCTRENIPCFQGSENDVLDRFYQTARAFCADVIIRITADCPLIDPEVIDDVAGLFFRSQVDYASNTEPPTFPDGLDVEIFSYKTLKRAHREASKRYQREHVTSYITENPNLFTRVNHTALRDLSHWRLTVDEPEDLELVRHIYTALDSPDRVFSFSQVVTYLDTHPECLSINTHKERNETYDTSDV